MRRNNYAVEEIKGEQLQDWNMNNAWHMEIMNLWREAAIYRQKRNDENSLEAYWDSLRSIWASMSYDVDVLIWSRREEEKDDPEIQRLAKIVENIEKNFEKANSMFMMANQRVANANLVAIKLLDELENQIKYLTGAIGYYKFRKDHIDMRYND